MANNIYVGNRYVPVFANPVEWDNLREYEPLTIVTYNGTAYTSRQTVPVGTALSNTDYWVVTGNYNAQVEQYRQEVVGVQNGLTAEVTNRTHADYMLDGGDLLCIGDSYLKGSNHTGTNFKSWGDWLAEYMGKTLNTSYFKYYHGGCGFVTTVDSKNFLALLNDAYNDITTPANVGTIVVMGGVNDIDSNNIASAIVTFVNTAKTLFPNAKVYYAHGSTFIDSPLGYILNEIKQYGNNYSSGIYLGNVSKYMSGYKLYDSDEQHPSADGQKLLGRVMYGAINGSGLPAVTRNSLQLGSGTYYYNYIADDMYCLGSYNKTDYNGLTVSSFSADGTHLAYTHTLDTTNLYFDKTDNNYFQCTTTGVIRVTNASSNQQYFECGINIKLVGNELRFYPYATNDDWHGYAEGTLTRIQIAPFEFKIPVTCI